MTKSKLDLGEALRLSREATEGPWYALGRCVSPDRPGLEQLETLLRCTTRNAIAEADAAFIAFARDFVPLAVARIRELESQAKEDEAAFQEITMILHDLNRGHRIREYDSELIAAARLAARTKETK